MNEAAYPDTASPDIWKMELQGLANELGLPIEVSHFPPGTSKWNKIEHRMFRQISKNWRGRPLETLEIIVNLIASTTTDSGLCIKCGVDKELFINNLCNTERKYVAKQGTLRVKCTSYL